MKISLKWLNDYVDVTDFYKNPQVLADALTRAGLEVEEIKNHAESLNHVVVGLIKVKDKHPNSEKLSLCQIEIAPGVIEQIICGAQNHKSGDKVIVALPGALLPGNFSIKKSKIRDVESNGMLCSYKEIGFPDKPSDGIVILPETAPIGKNYSEYAGLDDVTFELKVTPNRADCLSHYGLAREIGCLFNRSVKTIEVCSKFSTVKTTDKIKLEVHSSLCTRYSGRFIQNVKIGASPDWLKNRLESVGMNSINNVVDITNYVMLELGQPLHAFDADSLAGATIHVRAARAQEKFKTLKDQDLILSGEELLICDFEKPVALAGVIGGLNSGVNESTKNIFIESAHFNSMSVRKSSRTHGVETDSAYRFSRGVDASQTLIAMDRVSFLVNQCAEGVVSCAAHDFYPVPAVKKPIQITLKTVSDRLGYQAEEKLFLQFMNGLKCQVIQSSDGYLVTPPLFRFDLEQEMDLVEEYARLYGYENIQETLPVFAKDPSLHDQKYVLKNKISAVIQSTGFSQAFNYAFTSEKNENNFIQSFDVLNQYGLKTDPQSIPLKNPLNEDLNVLRRLSCVSIWNNTIENFRWGNNSGQLFEIGPVFWKNPTGDKTVFSENSRLTMSSWGNQEGLYSVTVPAVFKIRSSLEKLLTHLGITSYSFKSLLETPQFLHSGQAATLIVEGKNCGFIGTVHPQLLQNEKIRVDVAIAEINLDLILVGQPRALKYKSVSTNQMIDRDFSFIVDQNCVLNNLINEVKKSLGAICKDFRVFDIYTGQNLDKNLKSVSFRLTMQNTESDLTESIIQENMNKVITLAEKVIGAKLR